MPTKVLLADDQEMVRTGFRLIINNEEDLVVVDEAANGNQVIKEAHRTKPDVILMDIQMPELDGLATTKALVADGHNAKVLILITFEHDDYIFEAPHIGAAGFLLKNSPPEELIDAIRAIAEGDALLSPSVTKRVIETFARRSTPNKSPESLGQLTEREMQVFSLIAKGLSNSEIASKLILG